MGLADLMTVAEANASRSRACPKGESRLQETKAETKLERIGNTAFKLDVWKRDKSRCRCCLRKVIKQLARVPERGDVHHLHGRIGDLQFEAKAALLVCCECHEKLTGRVAEKWVAIGTKFWLLHGQRLIDARRPVLFKKVA